MYGKERPILAPILSRRRQNLRSSFVKKPVLHCISGSVFVSSSPSLLNSKLQADGVVFVQSPVYSQCDDKGFAHAEKIQKLVENFSQFVSFPIYMLLGKGYTKEVLILCGVFQYFFVLLAENEENQDLVLRST